MPKAATPKSLTDAPRVKVGVFDMDGILRGKIMSRNKFASALKDGFGFCDVVLGWDVDDQTYDNATFTGWHTAFPDARVRLLPTTRRDIPDEPDTPLALCEFVGDAEAVCPRGLLRRVLARAKKMGFSVRAACEFEFFLFEETPHSAREKGFRNLRPIYSRIFRLFDFAQFDARRIAPRIDGVLRKNANAAGRPAHRKRGGRFGGGVGGLRRAGSRGSSGAV